MKHLLKMLDLSSQEIIEILNLADQLKYVQRNGIAHRYLEGKTLAMIFQKASTRTRVSFEVGMYQLGGHALNLSVSELQMGRGEPICDTARVLSRYVDGIMIRTYAQEDVEELAKYSTVPVINGLTDFAHPCQVLADLMTIRELKGNFEKLKMCFIGDGNNMMNSLIVGCIKVGMKVSVACPKGYEPHKKVLEFVKGNSDFEITNSPDIAAADADVVITDVWASMGQEEEVKQRRADFKGFQVNKKLMELANPDAIVLHCLPAHRGEEITDEVFEQHATEIFEEAENRLHAQKAVLVKLLKQK